MTAAREDALSERAQRAIEHEGRIIGFVAYSYTSSELGDVYRAHRPGDWDRRCYDTYEGCIAWLMRQEAER